MLNASAELKFSLQWNERKKGQFPKKLRRHSVWWRRANARNVSFVIPSRWKFDSPQFFYLRQRQRCFFKWFDHDKRRSQKRPNDDDDDDDDDPGVPPGGHPPSKMPEDYGYEISHYFVALGPDKTSLIATKILYFKTITFALVRYKMVNIDQIVKGIWLLPRVWLLPRYYTSKQLHSRLLDIRWYNIDQIVKGISDDMVQYLERRCLSSLDATSRNRANPSKKIDMSHVVFGGDISLPSLSSIDLRVSSDKKKNDLQAEISGCRRYCYHALFLLSCVLCLFSTHSWTERSVMSW